MRTDRADDEKLCPQDMAEVDMIDPKRAFTVVMAEVRIHCVGGPTALPAQF